MYVFKTSDTVVSKSEKLKTTVHYIREALRGNAKRRIDVIFLTHPSIKITSSVVMNAYPRGIMSRASTDFWSDFRGRIYFRGFRGRTFFRGKHFYVRTSKDFVELYGLGGGSTDNTLYHIVYV